MLETMEERRRSVTSRYWRRNRISIEFHKSGKTEGRDMINAAVLGYGTVGSGVVEVIETNKDVIDKGQDRSCM